MGRLFHYVFCAACRLEEGDLGGSFLVEERVGEYFDDAELCHRRFHACELLTAILDAQPCASRNVVIDAVLHLGAFLGCFLRGNGRWDGFQHLEGHGDGFACQVVGIHHAELLREAEEHVAVGLLLWVVEEGEDFCVGLLGSAEERLEDRGLFVKLIEHEFQLCSVLGCVVCFASDEGVLAVADVVDFLCTEFCHLGCAAGGEDFLCHVGTRILGRRSFLWLGQFGQEVFLGIGVDAEKQSVAAEPDEGCNGLAFELDAVGLGLVWFPVGFQRDALQVPSHALLRRHSGHAQVAVGILVEVAGSRGCLFSYDGNAESGAGQVVADALERAARYERFHLSLRH